MAFKPKGLHPTNDVDAMRAHIFDFIHRSLIENDIRTNQKVPALLTRMPVSNPDGTAFTFELRKDIKWDDGTPFTVNDAVFSLKILVCPLVNNPSYKPTFLPIFKDIKKDSLNPYAFTFYTTGFNRSNLDMFLEIFMIQQSKWDPQHVLDNYSIPQFLSKDFVPDELLSKWAEQFNNKENSTRLSSLEGLGQYRVTSWEPDSYMILEKKKNWWGKNDTSFHNQAYPEKIIFKLILDESSVYQSIKNQQLDVTNRFSTSRLIKLRKHDYFNENYYSTFTDQYAYTYICFNSRPYGEKRKPLFTSKRVRRAIAHLVPVDDIIKIFSKGQARRMITCVYPFKKEYHKELKPIPYDPEKAIKLLEEEGWRDTDGDNIRDKIINGEKVKFSFDLIYPSIIPGNKDICLLIKDCLYKAGIEMNLAGREFAQLYQDCYNHDFDASLGSWLGSAGHEDFSQLFSTTSWKMHGENFGGFGDEFTDSLIQAANTTQDEKTYISILHRFQAIVYDEQPYVFLMIPKNKIIIHKRFINPHAYIDKPNFYLNTLRLNTKAGNTVKPTAL